MMQGAQNLTMTESRSSVANAHTGHLSKGDGETTHRAENHDQIREISSTLTPFAITILIDIISQQSGHLTKTDGDKKRELQETLDHALRVAPRIISHHTRTMAEGTTDQLAINLLEEVMTIADHIMINQAEDQIDNTKTSHIEAIIMTTGCPDKRQAKAISDHSQETIPQDCITPINRECSQAKIKIATLPLWHHDRHQLSQVLLPKQPDLHELLKPRVRRT
jgi:hypothetical protein